jgi:23S rRNA (cytosine1962-C5)-methyltransferase
MGKAAMKKKVLDHQENRPTTVYALLDSGFEEKFEQFGPIQLIRPCSQAVWKTTLSKQEWAKADARFTRDGGSRWIKKTALPDQWIVEVEGIQFLLKPTDFGHLGIFPEHAFQWRFIEDKIRSANRQVEILNLFAYTGGATLISARAGAKVCHLDASKAAVAWARENAKVNDLHEHPIRWIVEDVMKFLHREIKRGHRYDGIILDPPSFGRGKQGEVFKIESDLLEILDACRKLLSETPLFLVFTSHTLGFSPLVMEHLLGQTTDGLKGQTDHGEMLIPCKKGLPLPCGYFARWSAHGAA